MAVIVPTDIGVVPYTLVAGPRRGRNELAPRASVTSFRIGLTMKLDKDAGQVLVAESALQFSGRRVCDGQTPLYSPSLYLYSEYVLQMLRPRERITFFAMTFYPSAIVGY